MPLSGLTTNARRKRVLKEKKKLAAAAAAAASTAGASPSAETNDTATPVDPDPSPQRKRGRPAGSCRRWNPAKYRRKTTSGARPPRDTKTTCSTRSNTRLLPEQTRASPEAYVARPAQSAYKGQSNHHWLKTKAHLEGCISTLKTRSTFYEEGHKSALAREHDLHAQLIKTYQLIGLILFDSQTFQPRSRHPK